MREKIKIIRKILNVILYVYAFYITLRGAWLVVVRENAWLMVAVVVLVCPVTYWLLRRKFGEKHLRAVQVFCAVVLVLSPFLAGFALIQAPTYRCFDLAAEREAKTYFREHIETEQIEYKEVSVIKKQVYADYNHVAATVEYADRKTGQTMQQEVLMYFDRINGEWFSTFEEMREYRREHAGEEIWRTSHFEQNALNARADEVVGYVTGNDYQGLQPVLDEQCRAALTDRKWEDWQREILPLGVFGGVADSTISVQEAEDAAMTQTLTLVLDLKFDSGTARLEMDVNEDLTLGRLELKAEAP